MTYAQLYGGASGFDVYGFAAESSELCWDSDSSGGAPSASSNSSRVFGGALVPRCLIVECVHVFFEAEATPVILRSVKGPAVARA